MNNNVLKRSLGFALVGLLGVCLSAFAEEPLTCSLSVKPLKGDSTVKRTGGGNSNRGSSSSTTIFERNLKYKVVASFHGPTPQKPVLKVWYVGFGNGGRDMIEIGHETRPLELTDKARAEVELKSPTATMTKVKKVSRGGRGSRGGGGSKSTTTGERVTGCVMQVFAGETFLKSWASDSRWAKAAKNPSFTLDLINPKSAANKKK